MTAIDFLLSRQIRVAARTGKSRGVSFVEITLSKDVLKLKYRFHFANLSEVNTALVFQHLVSDCNSVMIPFESWEHDFDTVDEAREAYYETKKRAMILNSMVGDIAGLTDAVTPSAVA